MVNDKKKTLLLLLFLGIIFLIGVVNAFNYTSDYGTTSDFTASHTTKLGTIWRVNNASFGYIVNITKFATSNSSVVYIQTEYASGIVAQANFSGNVATFSPRVNLIGNATYYILADRRFINGTIENRTEALDLGISYPISSGGGVYVTGINQLGDNDTANGFVFENIIWDDGTGIAISVTLNSPANNTIFTTNNVTLKANVTNSTGIRIQNVSLLINGTINQTNTSGIVGVYEFNKTLVDSFYNWTVKAFGNDSVQYNATNGTLLFKINTAPNVTLNLPANNTITTNQTVIFNATVNANFDISSVRLYLNGVLNETNTSGISGQYIFTKILSFGNYNWRIIGESSNNGTNQSATRTFTISPSILNSITFNSQSYETATETFTANITTSNDSEITNALLNYKGTSYSATVTDGNNYFLLSGSINVPIGSGNNTFNFTYMVGGSINDATVNFGQNVNTINFTMKSNTTSCDADSLSYLNFSFQDEANFSSLNAKNELSEAKFWLGSGSINKTLVTSNVTANPFYVFCFNPQNRTLFTYLTFKYSATNYPLRTFVYDNQSLTNSTTNKTLYLLSTSDGIYSSFSIIKSSGATVQGATVLIERQFSGVWVTVGQDTTGSDGIATFWVNPNFQHRITVTKTGFISAQVTITPSQAIYTITLSVVSGGAEYSSPIPGLLWTVQPATGTISSGTSTNFNVTINSSEANLENCKFELINATNLSHVFATGTSIATNSSYCFVNVIYTPILNQNFFGRLSVDTTNITGFVIVNADWKWIVIDIEQNRWREIKSFFEDIMTIGEFGEGNEAKFSKIVTFFVITTILMSVLIYFTGIEFNNPGVTIIILWFITFIASAGGFLAFDSGSDNVNSTMEKWGFSFIFTIYAINYFLTIIRRSQE